MDAVERNGYGLIHVSHPAYSPDLTSSDIFLFPNLKKDIGGCYFRLTKIFFFFFFSGEGGGGGGGGWGRILCNI